MITASDLADNDTDTEGDTPDRHRRRQRRSAAPSSLDARHDHVHARPPTCAATTRPRFDYTVEDGNGGTAHRHGHHRPHLRERRPGRRRRHRHGHRGHGDRRHRQRLLDNDTDVDTDDTLTITDVDERHGRHGRPRRRRRHLHPDRRPVRRRRGRLRLRASPTARRPTPATSPSTSPARTTHPVADDDDAIGHRGHRRRDHGRRPGRQRHRRRRRRHADRHAPSRTPRGGTVSLDGRHDHLHPDRQPVRRRRGLASTTRSTDGNGGSDTGTVTIDLTCVNDAPVAVDDTASVDGNSAAADHDVLANDTDVDAATPSRSSRPCSTPASGTVDVVSRQGPLHAGQAGFNGQAVITYIVTDGDDTDTGTLTITVGGDVDRPGRRGPDRRLRHRPGRRDGSDQGLLVGHGRPVRRRLVRSAGERRRGLVQGPLRRHRHLDHQALRLQAAPGLPGPGTGHPRQLVRLGHVLGAQDRRLSRTATRTSRTAASGPA